MKTIGFRGTRFSDKPISLVFGVGLVKLVIGGPPCQVSRLRNKGPPGPRRGGLDEDWKGLAWRIWALDGVGRWGHGFVPQTGGTMEKGRRGSRAENWWCRCLAGSYRLSSWVSPGSSDLFGWARKPMCQFVCAVIRTCWAMLFLMFLQWAQVCK